MPLRPIDAIFVHPERRFCVVYYRGELWQLPRMKIDKAAWQRKRPYTGAKEALYLSQRQDLEDRFMARKLRTLDLPIAVRGIAMPRFEAWWEMHGFEWLKERIDRGSSPLAAHQKKPKSTAKNANNINNKASNPTPNPNKPVSDSNKAAHVNGQKNKQQNNNKGKISNENSTNNSNKDLNPDNEAIVATSHTEQLDASDTDIFASMLAELTNEVLNYRR